MLHPAYKNLKWRRKYDVILLRILVIGPFAALHWVSGKVHDVTHRIGQFLDSKLPEPGYWYDGPER